MTRSVIVDPVPPVLLSVREMDWFGLSNQIVTSSFVSVHTPGAPPSRPLGGLRSAWTLTLSLSPVPRGSNWMGVKTVPAAGQAEVEIPYGFAPADRSAAVIQSIAYWPSSCEDDPSIMLFDARKTWPATNTADAISTSPIATASSNSTSV
jgi:hypothetical protein